MTKQDDIREGIREVIEYHFGFRLADKTVEEILRKMDSQGVVLKVDGELPKSHHRSTQENMLKAGYTAVEPLIGG